MPQFCHKLYFDSLQKLPFNECLALAALCSLRKKKKKKSPSSCKSPYYSRENPETKCGQGEAPPIIYILLARVVGAFLSLVLRCPARPDSSHRVRAKPSHLYHRRTFLHFLLGCVGKVFAASPGTVNGKLYLNVRVCGCHLWLNRNYTPGAHAVPN